MLGRRLAWHAEEREEPQLHHARAQPKQIRHRDERVVRHQRELREGERTFGRGGDGRRQREVTRAALLQACLAR